MQLADQTLPYLCRAKLNYCVSGLQTEEDIKQKLFEVQGQSAAPASRNECSKARLPFLASLALL